MKIKLNDDQASALAQILAAYHAGETRHALTGNAGTGKTTLMQAVVAKFLEKGVSICVTAPTHKAVSVLARKLRDAGLSSIKAMTIHSLLGLKVSPNDEENTTLKRNGPSQVSAYRVVVIDEASMVSSDLFDFIEEDLKQRFVLFVGDPAQLPPVGEIETRCFSVCGKSYLSRIVRQAEGNPIIRAAQMIRERQDTTPDWDWTLPAEAGAIGIYRAGDEPMRGCAMRSCHQNSNMIMIHFDISATPMRASPRSTPRSGPGFMGQRRRRSWPANAPSVGRRY